MRYGYEMNRDGSRIQSSEKKLEKDFWVYLYQSYDLKVADRAM